MSGRAVIEAPFVATAKQNEVADHWHDPACHIVTFGGAIRAGKTQAAGRLIVETAVKVPATFLIARLTYRELEDSTKKVMLHGDGNLPPLIPRELVAEYRATDNLVRLHGGATILFRSLEDPGKLLNLTLGGVLIDQIEELDSGVEGERIFDTLLGRLSDPRGPRKLIAVANPASTIHWAYRRLVNPATRDTGAEYVHVSMADNAAHLPADYVARHMALRETQPHRYRTFVLGEWGSFEGAAFTEFSEQVHVVEPFLIPGTWERFESLDHGASNPTAILAWAADHDGNVVVFDSYNSPGLVSQHAPALLERRERGTLLSGGIRNVWQLPGEENLCWADPSVWANHGHANQWGAPASIATEYLDRDIRLLQANNDRAAGYMRLLELLHIDPLRFAPPWSQVPEGVKGSPRLFVFSHCRLLIEQIKGAPVATDGPNAGECVDPKWTSSHGHQLDALRYGAMSRPAPSPVPVPEPTDPREWGLRQLIVRENDDLDDLEEELDDWHVYAHLETGGGW